MRFARPIIVGFAALALVAMSGCGQSGDKPKDSSSGSPAASSSSDATVPEASNTSTVAPADKGSGTAKTDAPKADGPRPSGDLKDFNAAKLPKNFGDWNAKSDPTKIAIYTNSKGEEMTAMISKLTGDGATMTGVLKEPKTSAHAVCGKLSTGPSQCVFFLKGGVMTFKGKGEESVDDLSKIGEELYAKI